MTVSQKHTSRQIVNVKHERQSCPLFDPSEFDSYAILQSLFHCPPSHWNSMCTHKLRNSHWAYHPLIYKNIVMYS